MKTIICRQVGELVVKEDAIPEPQQGETLLRIARVGICGTDLHAYRGKQPFFSYPRVLGHELAGFVERVGDEKGPFVPGDPVLVVPYLECGVCIACRSGKGNCCTNMRVLGVHLDGGMREFMIVPTNHLLSAKGLTLDQAVIVEPLSIGAHAVRRAEPKPSEHVLVIGGGPIGLGIMALAKQRGARVIAMDTNEERLAFSQSWANVDYVVNATENPQEKLAEITDGELAPVVIDATGNQGSMTAAFDYVAHGGRLVYVGLIRSEISFDDPDFHKKEMTLMGSRNATAEDFEAVIQAMKRGMIDADAYITHRADFANATSEFERWLDPSSSVIKAVIEL